jgi:hypothetical protein
MSGSLTWRQYTTDAGIAYSIKIDESNANGTVGTAAGALCPVRTANLPLPPCGFKGRYVNTYNQALPVQKRRFLIGSLSALSALALPGSTIVASANAGPGDTAGATATWVVSSIRGERLRLAPAFGAPDTGLTDGTTTQ